jgi:histidine triad (HIT) family protein
MTKPEKSCVFCAIVAGEAPAAIVREWSSALAFIPLDPVVTGHVLVIPKTHVEDFTKDPLVSGMTMLRASELADDLGGPMNLIASKGREATQSVFHLHIHLVPRAVGDRLALPWYSGKASS